MANPNCPRCGGYTDLEARDPDRYCCRSCRHVWVDDRPEGGW